jgi:hypothetical protein
VRFLRSHATETLNDQKYSHSSFLGSSAIPL